MLAGGLAILCAVFAELGIERMGYTNGALRLGVLYDLIGRFGHHDMRVIRRCASSRGAIRSMGARRNASRRRRSSCSPVDDEPVRIRERRAS